MRMLDALRTRLDEIEQDNEKAHGFVERLLIEYEETGKAPKLTGRQFKYLSDLCERYCQTR